MAHLLTNIGVYALVVKDNKLLLLHKPGDPIWTALGGRMDENDKDPVESLRREIKEEIGCDVKIGDILDVKLWSIDGKNHRLGIFYVCKIEDEEKIKLSEEHDDFKFFSFDEAVKMWKQLDRGAHGIELGTKLKEEGYIQ